MRFIIKLIYEWPKACSCARAPSLYSLTRIEKWIDSSIGQSTAIQEFEEKRPKLSDLNQTQNRKYVNFANGSYFICSLNLNNPELTDFFCF